MSQLVSENCHDRLRCMEKLTEVEEEYAQSTQTFPSHSIRYNKPPTPPRRCKNVHRQLAAANTGGGNTHSNEHNNNNKNDVDDEELLTTDGSAVLANVAIPRPNFLALRKEPAPHLPYFRKAPPPPSKPIRSAPPPPPILATAAITTADPASPIQEPLNVSLNVTVSPVTQRRRAQRHTSELNVQPEMPYSPPADGELGSRSYTSVNFTLRPPSEENAQSPIDICAGPSLTYSSNSYDARQGYQSSLKIIVGGPSGGPTAFSAMRTRSRSGLDESEEPVSQQQQQQATQQQQYRVPQNVMIAASNAFKGAIPLPSLQVADSRGIISPLREGKSCDFYFSTFLEEN